MPQNVRNLPELQPLRGHHQEFQSTSTRSQSQAEPMSSTGISLDVLF